MNYLDNDPDTEFINDICNDLIGAKILISYNITFLNGTTDSGLIENIDIVGNSIQDILLPHLQNKIPTIEKGPKQKSPDFWNRNRSYEWELKVFTGSPRFDVSNYISYIEQLNKINGVNRKMFKTKYLIFKYTKRENYIVIEDFKLCSVWKLLSYNGVNPISLQNKRGTWYTIRPCGFSNIGDDNKYPHTFIKNICKSILMCPNKLEDRNEKIQNINKQFTRCIFTDCLYAINNLTLSV